MSEVIGQGVFSWERTERVTKRYGSFGVTPSGNNPRNRSETNFLNVSALLDLEFHRVKITAKVIGLGESEHLGDLYVVDPTTGQPIKPSTPKLNEEFVLGVGVLRLMPTDQDFTGKFFIGIQPENMREMFWMDPRTLYQLHEQTVQLFVEKSDEPELPQTSLVWKSEATVTVTEVDNKIVNFQMNKTSGNRIPPKFESLGDGLFVLRPQIENAKVGDTFETN